MVNISKFREYNGVIIVKSNKTKNINNGINKNKYYLE